MATATLNRPSAPTTTEASSITPVPTNGEAPTTRDKVLAYLAVGGAGALTLGIFGWAVWVSSQISVPL